MEWFMFLPLIVVPAFLGAGAYFLPYIRRHWRRVGEGESTPDVDPQKLGLPGRSSRDVRGTARFWRSGQRAQATPSEYLGKILKTMTRGRETPRAACGGLP